MMLHFIIAAAILFGRVDLYPLIYLDTCSNPCSNPCVSNNEQPACTKCCPQCLEPYIQCRPRGYGSVTLVYKQNGVVLIDDDVDSDVLFDFIGSDYDNTSSRRLVYGHCRYCKQLDFEDTESKPTVIVAQNSTFRDLCKENATGFLCSRCVDGFHHNRNGDCVSCSNPALHWFIFILIEIVPITILFIILYITGFNLVSGGLNSAIFFAQMITTTMDITGDGFIPISNITNNSQTSASLIGAYRFLYEPWNLEFFAPFSRNLCLFHAESFLVYFLVEYIIAFYPILLLVAVVAIRAIYSKLPESYSSKCSRIAKFLSKCDWKEANRDLTGSILVLSYSKLATTSASLLSGDGLYDSNGGFVRLVSLNDPSINYISFPYLMFAIIAGIIVILLFSYPFLIIAVTYLRDYKKSKFLSFLDGLVSPFRQMTDDVQDLFDGLDKALSHFRDHRWVETAYFILRVTLLIIYITPLTFIRKYIVEQGILLIGMMFIVFLSPSEQKKWLSRVDMFMLLLLVFINTLSIYQYSLTQSSLPLAVSTFVVQYILIFVPAVWMIGYFGTAFIMRIKSHLHQRKTVRSAS